MKTIVQDAEERKNAVPYDHYDYDLEHGLVLLRGIDIDWNEIRHIVVEPNRDGGGFRLTIWHHVGPENGREYLLVDDMDDVTTILKEWSERTQ